MLVGGSTESTSSCRNLCQCVFALTQTRSSDMIQCVIWPMILIFVHVATCFRQSHRKNQQDAAVQQNLLFQCFLIAQHVSSDTAHHQELKHCNCSLWFYIRLWLPAAVMAECRSKRVEQLRNIGIINSTTRLHFVDYFYKIYIMMNGSMNIKFIYTQFIQELTL